MIVLDILAPMLDPLVAVGWLLGGFFAHRWWHAALAGAIWAQVVYALLLHFLGDAEESVDPVFAAGTAALYAVAALLVFGLKRSLVRR